MKWCAKLKFIWIFHEVCLVRIFCSNQFNKLTSLNYHNFTPSTPNVIIFPTWPSQKNLHNFSKKISNFYSHFSFLHLKERKIPIYPYLQQGRDSLNDTRMKNCRKEILKRVKSFDYCFIHQYVCGVCMGVELVFSVYGDNGCIKLVLMWMFG